MTRKFAGLADYKVCALEGLWWAKGIEGDFTAIPREQWRWKLLIRTPDFIPAADLASAQAAMAAKGKTALAADVRLESITEGPCVQVLHVGPYADERPTIQRMIDFAAAHGCRRAAGTTTIYLNDPRRTAPAKLRTILRHPVAKS